MKPWNVWYLVCFVLVSGMNVIAQMPVRPVGMNLSFMYDYSPQWVFVDVMKQSREWFVQEHVDFPAFSVEGINIPARADGYPTKVPFTVGSKQYRVHTLLVRELTFGYPSGMYTVEFEGKGKLLIDFDATRTELTQSGVPHRINVNATQNGIHVTILESLESDPVRNIRVVMPGFENTYRTAPFHPTFLGYLRGINVLRYMSPQLTNLTEIISPAGRSTPATYTQVSAAAGGLAWEYIAELSNTTGTDPWICLPVFANDSLVRECARVFKAQLKPERKVYVEYGNEFWNSAYPFSTGHNHARQQGAAEKLSDDSFIGGLIWVTKRSVEMFSLFEEEFGGTSRLVRILAAQGANSFTGQQMLRALSNPVVNPKGKKVDALAIAPYFGNELADMVASRAATITTNEILTTLDSLVRVETPAIVAANKRETDAAGVQLVAYESGQHLAAVESANRENTTLTEKLIAVNRDPKMRDIYCRYYDAWYNGGGKLFNVFDYVSNFSKFGSWGQLEHLRQDTAISPKLSALISCVVARNTSTFVSQNHNLNTIKHPTFYPQPAGTELHIHYDDDVFVSGFQPGRAKTIQVRFLNLLGAVQQTNVALNAGLPLVVPVDALPAGTYICELRAGDWYFRKIVIVSR